MYQNLLNQSQHIQMGWLQRRLICILEDIRDPVECPSGAHCTLNPDPAEVLTLFLAGGCQRDRKFSLIDRGIGHCEISLQGPKKVGLMRKPLSFDGT